ncbi:MULTISPECIES: hypothetical protein [unclassified Streptomyces]|uniref:hypothetical protein n=1 Tax=unclassified Streptomyces TaxID=2593676 RepID=UPI00081E89CD|nr:MULTISPECIES: hypothetical protein [unclassified Streptomyces]MYZ36161.1 hypothetical protein [Streptomyces sp. SID4917]SCF81393.1 hypothetical protein GA0115259_102998 [Streptomyces sp. MnatMP-M17]
MGLLSWLRGDRAEVSDAVDATDAMPATETTDTVDAADATGAARIASPPGRAVAGWRELPPVQRTVTTPGLVTDPDGFRGSLGSWQDATLTTPLGHLVSPQAPSGLMHGLVASRGPTTVSRWAEDGVVASWPTAPTPAGRMPGQAQARVQARIQPTAMPVQRSEAAGSLVSAGTSPAELPVRQLIGERPVEPSLPSASQPELPAAASAPASSGSAAPPVRDSSRMPGLGAPLAGLPPTAQRQIAARVPGPTTDSTEPPDPTGANFPPDAGTSARPLLGDAPSLVQRHMEQHAPHHPQQHAQDHPTVPPSPGRSPTLTPLRIQRLHGPGTLPRPTTEPASGPVAPLVAQRAMPLFATGPDAPTASPMASVSGHTEPEPPVVPVRWSAPHPETAVQRSSDTGDRAARTVMAPPPAQLLPAQASPAQLPPAVQRQWQRQPQQQPQPRTFGGPPSPRSVSGALSTSGFRDAGSVAVAAGVAQRMADGSVVFGIPAAQATGAAQAARTVQRQAMSNETPPPLPVPDLVPDSSPEPTPEPAPEPETAPAPEQSEESAADAADPASAFPDAATAASGPSAQAPPVTDELVRALYAPLSRLLKADLRLERERAGFLINTRH